MPRPFNPAAVPSVHLNPPLKHPLGHTITIYSDNAVYDETDSKFIPVDSLTRKG